MARKPQAVLPITPATVTILGSVYKGNSTIWAGLRLHEAQLQHEKCLGVPWCHIDDPWPDGGCVYRVRPLQEGYEFAKARNGAWVLRYTGAADD